MPNEQQKKAARETLETLKQINAEYHKANKANSALVSISQKLTDSMVSQERLSSSELVKLQDKSKAAMENLKAAQSLANQTIKELQGKKGLLKADKNRLADAKTLLRSQEAGNVIEQELLDDLEKEIKKRDEVNEALGITGGVLKGLAGALGSFGKTLGIGKAATAMEDYAFAAKDAGKSVSRIGTLGAGLKSMGGSLVKSLTDPAVVITAILKSFGELAKAEKEFRQLTGASTSSVQVLNDSMTTGAEYIKAATALSKELGVNASSVFPPETIIEVAELTENMGLSAKSAATLAKLSKKSGQELSVVTDNMEASAKAFVASNNTSINLRDVMEDVGNASAAVQISMGGSVDKIQEAAMQARKLGVSLEQVDAIAGSLLDFEKSIEAEMEAELLTGKQLNLEKARQLALDNDLAGVAKEIGKQQGIMQAFATGNRIQQEAAAKALGMSREDMAKMVLQQNIVKLGSVEAAAAASDMSLEEAKRLTTSEQMSKSVTKITEGLASALLPVAKLLSNTFVLKGIMITIGGIMAAKILPSIVKAGKGMFSMAKGAKEYLKTVTKGGGGVGDKGGGIFSKLKAGLAKKTKGMDKKKGEGSEGFLSGLGKGLASIGKSMGDVIKGSIALGIAGLVLGGAFALAMMMIKDVDPIQMIAFAASLSILGLTVAILGMVGGNIIMGALAMGILALALIPAAYAFSLLKDVDTNKMLAFALILPLLGLAMAGLGFIAPFVMLGAAALGFMALALVPLALMGPGLGIAATALKEMAASLREVGSALGDIDENKLDALEDFAITSAVTGAASGIMAAIVSPIAALGGMLGGDDEEDPQQQVVEKLNELIAIVKEGGDVILDGNKVGRNLAIASSKIG